MELKKYFLFQIVLQLIFILNKNFVKTEEYCPKICECYSFNGFNRATCSGQKLINAFIEISEFVEIFDLNDNKISVLDNNCFKQRIHLIELSIAHNKIHTIHFNAFLTLKKLRSIDLSYNQLQYINEKIFEYNYQLIEVNLSGNQFINLINEPLFISTSVQGLFLKDCRIAYIYPKIFSQLLSLKYLDLSKNLMITLTTEPFKSLIKLQQVNLEENRWNCDHNIIDVMNTLKSKQIDIKLTMCDLEFKKSNKVVKFEKIIVDPNLQINAEEYDQEEKYKKPITAVWNKIPITENLIESCLINDIRFACNLYISCLKNLTITSEALYNSENDIMKNLKKEKFFFHTIDHTELIFFFGVCIGAAIVFIMVACTLCVTKCCKNNQLENNKEDNELISANREFQFFHQDRPQSLTVATNERPPPVPVRLSSRRRRRRPPPPPPLNRSISSPARETPLRSVNDFASFVTRLFERPARHRYYRAFNENTAHLIRRLSRSSLVNNRLSQHFLNETGRSRNDRNNVANISREANTRERLGSVENDDLIDELQLFIQVPDDNITPIHRTENSIETNTTGSDIQRSQTPPPAYNDVVRV